MTSKNPRTAHARLVITSVVAVGVIAALAGGQVPVSSAIPGSDSAPPPRTLIGGPVAPELARKLDALDCKLDQMFGDVIAPQLDLLRSRAVREAARNWPQTFPPTQWAPPVLPAWPGTGVATLGDIPGGEAAAAPMAACFSPIDPPSPERMLEISLAMQDQGLVPQYQLGTRWTGTVGAPIALSWSLIPDGTNIPGGGGVGEPAAPSTLFARMDTLFGAANRATWIAQFQASFDRWAALTGISYTRITFGGNAWDDGAAFPTSSGNASRGAIRIGMHPIDGANGILAYNQFPQNGDMVMDSSENWASGGTPYTFLRNTILHEHGHGLGLAHVCPINGTKLMEPLLNTGFSGPQQDDVRAAQAFYGDAYENNDTSATATVLAATTVGVSLRPGTVPLPSLSNVRITSIDNNGDLDWYRSSAATPLIITVSVQPIGTNYADYAQDAACNNAVVNENALTSADLSFAVYGADAVLPLATINAVAAGVTESRTGILVQDGNFFVRVRDENTPTTVQLYELTITGVSTPSLSATDAVFTDRVQITFTAVANATSYRLYRNTSPDRPSAIALADPPITAGSFVSFSDATALPGITYYYWAEANQGLAGLKPIAGPDAGSIFVVAPGNNNCAFATALAVGGTATGTTLGATTDGTASCGGAAGDVWYTYTADCTGTVTLALSGATFDSTLSVNSACPAAPGNEVACADTPGGGNESLAFSAVGGSSYLIRVGTAAGTGTFSLTAGKTPVANDDCAGAMLLAPGASTTNFDTCSATSSLPTESCGGMIGADIWFRYTAGTDGLHTLSTCGSTVDTILFVYSASAGCPAAGGTALNCSDTGSCGTAAELTFTATTGVEYLIRVGGSGSASGPGSLTVTPPTPPPTCPADFNADGELNPDDLADYIGAYFAVPPGSGADYNADGEVNPDDLADFIGAFFAGCG